MNTRSIDFYFDFSSSYSYIASEWIEALAARHGRAVRWKVILLGVTFQAAELKSPVFHPMKREYVIHDTKRSARFAGVPFRMPEKFPVATQNAARVFLWLQEQSPERAVAWARHGLRALFTRGVDLADPEALRGLAMEFGLQPDEAEGVWTNPHWKDCLRKANDEAIATGVFGAPYFVIDGEPFWGNDRREQMERWLGQGRF